MENNDMNSIFAMDAENGVHLVNLTTKQLTWTKKMHSGCTCFKFGLKRSNDEKRLATTGCCDKLVKLWRLEDQSELWAKNIGSQAWGVAWVLGDTYLIATGLKSTYKLVVLSPVDGNILLEHNTNFDCTLRSLAIHLPTKQILIGDNKGRVHKVKIEE